MDKNPQKLLDAKHPYATQLFAKFNKVPMTPNPTITDEEIDAILAFIANPPAEETATVAGSENPYLQLETTTSATQKAQVVFSAVLHFCNSL